MKLDNPDEILYNNIETVGFTGTREGATKEQLKSVRWLLRKMKPSILVHGDCVGADADVHAVALDLGIKVHMRPANMPRYRAHCKGGEVIAPEEDPLDRNKKIVRSANAMIACPKEFKNELRSGTWSTVRYASKEECLCWIVYPDGSVDYPSV